mgnify:CR=1 FL=1
MSLQFGTVPNSPTQFILVVDDEPQVCEILEDALIARGHQVDSAKDGLDAIDKIKNGQYSVIITDFL